MVFGASVRWSFVTPSMVMYMVEMKYPAGNPGVVDGTGVVVAACRAANSLSGGIAMVGAASGKASAIAKWA